LRQRLPALAAAEVTAEDVGPAAVEVMEPVKQLLPLTAHAEQLVQAAVVMDVARLRQRHLLHRLRRLWICA
jgi:hypothetical protein